MKKVFVIGMMMTMVSSVFAEQGKVGSVGSSTSTSFTSERYPDIYPEQLRFSDERNDGLVGVQLTEEKEAAPFTVDRPLGFKVYVHGSFVFNKDRTTMLGSSGVYLRKEDGNKIVGDITHLAGMLNGWNGSGHLCHGEEEWGSRPTGFIGEYSPKSIADFALQKARESCVKSGGQVIENRQDVETFGETRVRILSHALRLVPVPRKCYGALARVTCDFSGKTNDVKNLANEVKLKFPSHPAIPELEAFVKGL